MLLLIVGLQGIWLRRKRRQLGVAGRKAKKQKAKTGKKKSAWVA